MCFIKRSQEVHSSAVDLLLNVVLNGAGDIRGSSNVLYYKESFIFTMVLMPHT